MWWADHGEHLQCKIMNKSTSCHESLSSSFWDRLCMWDTRPSVSTVLLWLKEQEVEALGSFLTWNQLGRAMPCKALCCNWPGLFLGNWYSFYWAHFFPYRIYILLHPVPFSLTIVVVNYMLHTLKISEWDPMTEYWDTSLWHLAALHLLNTLSRRWVCVKFCIYCLFLYFFFSPVYLHQFGVFQEGWVLFYGGRTSKTGSWLELKGFLFCLCSNGSIHLTRCDCMFLTGQNEPQRHMFVLECFLMCRAVVFPLFQPSEYVLEVFKKVKSRWVPRALLLNRLVLKNWISELVGVLCWTSVLSGWCWRVEVTLWQPFFGTGEWEFVHEEYSAKLVYGCWLPGDVCVCEEEIGDTEDGMLCLLFVSEDACCRGPGLCFVLCGQAQTSSGEHSAQLLCQNLPTWKHYLLIYSSAVAETIVIISLLLSELEESLLVLPFSYVPDLLRLFNEHIHLGAEIELLCRALLFLLKWVFYVPRQGCWSKFSCHYCPDPEC